MFFAFMLVVLARAAAGAAPDVLYVSGTGIDELDGTYIREGTLVDAHKCLFDDGVRWRSENSKYVIQGFLGRFYIDESGVDYFYEAEYDGCDPGAGLAWRANARHRDAGAAREWLHVHGAGGGGTTLPSRRGAIGRLVLLDGRLDPGEPRRHRRDPGRPRGHPRLARL